MMKRGTVVRASAGRDKDGLFVVLGEKNGYVLICNGKRRPVDRPKRKNPSHLKPTEDTLPEEGLKTNRMIRKALARLPGADD